MPQKWERRDWSRLTHNTTIYSCTHSANTHRWKSPMYSVVVVECWFASGLKIFLKIHSRFCSINCKYNLWSDLQPHTDDIAIKITFCLIDYVGFFICCHNLSQNNACLPWCRCCRSAEVRKLKQMEMDAEQDILNMKQQKLAQDFRREEEKKRVRGDNPSSSSLFKALCFLFSQYLYFSRCLLVRHFLIHFWNALLTSKIICFQSPNYVPWLK